MIPKCKQTENRVSNLENANVYSTEEKRIGTWFGKPLYRKGYALEVSDYRYKEIGILENVESLVYSRTSYTMSNGIHVVTGHDAYMNGTKVCIENDSLTDSTNIKCIVEYTKTTD